MGQNSTQDHPPFLSDRRANSIRLDSWKEIASYLHRDARTVRRWERERRLPIHRVPGGERSGVFAYVSELDRWLRAKDEGTAVLDAGPSEGSSHALYTFPSGEVITEASAEDVPAAPDVLPANDTQSSIEQVPVAASPSLNQIPFLHAVANAPLPSSDCGSPISDWQGPARENTLSTHFPKGGVEAARLQSKSDRWAFHGMALLLLLAIAGGSGFAFVHYRRFHQSVAGNAHPSPEAKDLYLRGRYFWNLRTEEGLNQALDLFTQSIVHDPHYAPAYAGLADSYLLLRQYGHMPDSEAYPRALAAARQAVSLDASSPDAHRSIAFILRFWDWDMPAAEREYLRAIELDPKNAQSHHWYATALLSSGRVKEALAQIDLARELEPQSVSVLADRGLILSTLDPARGAQALKQLAQSQPEFASTHVYLAGVYLDLGDDAGFLAESRIVATLAHDPAKVIDLDHAREELAKRGPLPMLRNLAAKYAVVADRDQGSAYFTARLFGFAGDSGQAMHYLQVACDRRDPGFLSVENDAAFQAVRSSQRYLTLLERRDAAPDGRRPPIAQLDRVPPF